MRKKKYSNVIDFFTKANNEASLKEVIKQSGPIVDKYGRYLGCLKDPDAEYLLDLIEHNIFLQQQLEAMQQIVNSNQQQIQSRIQMCLNYMTIDFRKEITIEKDEFFITKDGHAYVVLQKDLEE